MGAVVSVLAKPLQSEAGKILTEEVLPSMTRSMEHVFSKFPEGQAFVGKLKNEWEPGVKKLAANYIHQQGWNPRDSVDVAKKVLHPQLFGSKAQVMNNLIVAAEKHRGEVFAGTIADHLNTYFGEHGISKARIGAKDILGTLRGGITSKVTASNSLERAIRKGTSAVSTSRIVIPHLSQPLNLILNNNYKSIVKGVLDYSSNPKQAATFVQTAGAMVDEMLHDTNTSKWYRNIVQPGFTQVRKLQINLSGTVGKHSAIDAAERLLKDPTNKYANVQLKFLGIKPTDVLTQKGLTQDNIDKAIYRMVDETMFFRSGLRTPAMWERNAAYRIGTMYKHFAFSEQKLMADSLKRSAKQGPAAFVRTVSALGILFPAVGEGIKQLENLATKSPDEPSKRIGYTQAKFISGDEQFANWASRYIDDFAHVAGLGIGYQMIRSISRHQLSNYFAGPFFGSAFDLLQDSWVAVTGKPHSLGRDIVKKIPVVGAYLSNELLPPKSNTSTHRQRRQRRSN